MIRRPPRSTLFPYTTPSDLKNMAKCWRPTACPGCSRKVIRAAGRDRKSTRLNSSHVEISYAVFCLKKKKHMRVIGEIEGSIQMLVNCSAPSHQLVTPPNTLV